jgi:hypothetical protein
MGGWRQNGANLVPAAAIGWYYRGPGILCSLMAIYERIKAWERCHQLCVAVYNVTNTWPTSELDELHRKAGGMTWLLYKSLLAKKVTTAHPQ